MGFRDIREFNRALLAKQLWRMISNPESLVAKVFRARYCKDGNFMTAPVNSNSSFIWRSIVWSRGIDDLGSSWKVGDGKDISVYRDRWVAGLTSSLRRFGELEFMADLQVNDLLTSGGVWDEVLIRGLFSPVAADGVLATVIGESGRRDQRRWRFDEKGKFSVKSAYLAAIGFYEMDPNVSNPDRKVWSKLVWSVAIPPKARIFLWRAFNNLIPTAANLRRHHVPTTGVCALCRCLWGSTEHCLLFCQKIHRVWKESRFGAVVKRAHGLDLLGVAEAVRKECGEGDYGLWALLLWQVWVYACRAMHSHDGDVELPSELDGVAMWDAYLAARPTVLQEQSLGVTLGNKTWSRPRRDRFRVDVDAHFNPAARAFGVGVVVRDANGKLVAALAKATSPSSSPMMAEVMAVIHGVVFCVENDIAPVEVFTDSILAARVMADPDEEGDLLPDDICDILRVARENMLVGVRHMYRSANSVAHSLALRGSCSSQACCWTASFPSWLRVLASEDDSD